MNRTFLVVTAAVGISAGILAATYGFYGQRYKEDAQSYIIDIGEKATPVSYKSLCLTNYFCEENKALKWETAEYFVKEAEKALSHYKSDPQYQKGVAQKITAAHIVSVIITESRGNWLTCGSLDEIGLMQIRPLHTKNLFKAGILSEADPNLLWEADNNIASGVYIIMQIASNVDSLDRVFAIYNAGARREKAGRKYARNILDRTYILNQRSGS